MANWWESAPLAEGKPQPSAGANWWEAAPLVNDAAPVAGGVSTTTGADGRPRVVMDMSPQQKPDRGAIDATARGVASGLTANFSDEIRGLVEASGANPDEPASVYKLLHGALKYWGGDADAKKRYDEAATRERGLTKTAEEQHPYAALAGNVAGAIAVPIGGMVGAATLPGRMAAGAGIGAAIGGAAGVGEGIGAADSISRGVTGTLAGGAIGGLAPAAIEGVVRGARAIATPVANAVRGIRDTEGEAARRVTLGIQRDMQNDPGAASRLTPQEFAASVQSGGPATIMDIGGDTTRALARSAANTSPEGRATLSRTINDRFEGQTDRVTGWLRNTFHFPDADAQKVALDTTAKTVNRVRYAKAYQDGDREVMSPTIERLLGSPAMADAMQKASRSGKDRAITQGYGAFNPAVTVEDGIIRFHRKPNGVASYPNLAFWDATKRELDDAASAANRAGRKGEATVLGDLSRSLRAELDNIIPSYQQARAGAAHFFDASDALEAGQKFLGKNMSASEARRALSQMSPTERQLFQDGFVSKYIETLGQIGDRRSVLNKVAESPVAREKLNVALGREKAAELEAGLRVEGIMDLARNAVQGNSTTARQLAELGLAGGTYGLGTGGDILNPNPTALMNAALVYGAARGKSKINENLSKKVAELLTSSDPKILMRGIKLVARNENLFNSLRGADRGLARVGGENAPTSAALSMGGVGRADNQPDVPRPPSQ